MNLGVASREGLMEMRELRLYGEQNIPSHTYCFLALLSGFFVGDKAVSLVEPYDAFIVLNVGINSNETTGKVLFIT